MSIDNQVKEAILRQVKLEPFARKFGMELLELEEGYSKVAMTFTPDMKNLAGTAHGGALFALMDEAFETASNSHGTLAAALNMSVNYHAAPQPGVRLIAEAREYSRTRKTAHYDITLRDEHDTLIASCTALVYRKGVPLPYLEPSES